MSVAPTSRSTNAEDAGYDGFGERNAKAEYIISTKNDANCPQGSGCGALAGDKTQVWPLR